MNHCICSCLMALFLMIPNLHAQRMIEVDTRHLGAPIQPTMWGIFFEDINFGADGGLYAEMVENRSFEFPQPFMGWETFGNVELRDDQPAFPRNPHYVRLCYAGHKEKRTGLDNHGFFGFGLKEGMQYHFSVYARGKATLRVELVGSDHSVIDKQKMQVGGDEWQRYELSLTAKKTDEKAFLRIFHTEGDAVDIDHVSLFPADNWHGLRSDLVQLLKELHPGVFRFPGGCIVEGTQLSSRYQWKHSVGPAENRPLNENRWNYTFAHRMFPNYYQTYGLGFYELFLLSEYIGAEPLPILNVGLICQYQNEDAGVPLDSLDEYIQDALDLIELPDDELWQLCRIAFEQYKSEIIFGEKAYSRFIYDFFYYHFPVTAMSEADMRTHFMHVCEVVELLEERRDLVDAFFSKDEFEKEDYRQMLHLFNTGKGIEPTADFLAHFSDEQIASITEFVTSSSLFRTEVTEEIMKDLFECRLQRPLQANSNRNVALFFGALREHGLLPFQWQMILERNKLLASSANNEPLRASQLRCSLSQARNPKLGKKKKSNLKDEEVGFESTCRSFVLRLKESL